MKYATDPQRRILAGEYALGTLPPRARRRFERLLDGDAGLRAELTFWETHFAGLAPPPVTPPERVWAGLDRQLNALRVTPLRPQKSESGLWRGWALAATLASVALSLALWREVSRPPTVIREMVRVEVPVPAPAPYVAMLRPGNGGATYLISMTPESGVMKVAMSGAFPVDVDVKCLELWVLDDSGKPHSLGVLPEVAGEMKMPLPRDMPMPREPTLAVSVEPKGGSPTGQPTGPVIGTGRALRTS